MQIKQKTYVLLLIILLLQIIIRIPFINEPLQFDEGVYAYGGQRILEGKIPYKDFFDNKPPLIYYTYALNIKLLGNSVPSIRILLLIISLMTTVLVYSIGNKIFNNNTGLISAFLFALFSSGINIRGTNSYIENFSILFIILAYYFFIKHKKSHSVSALTLSGFFASIALLYKPTSLADLLPIFVFLLFSIIKKELKTLWFVAAFITTPFLWVAYYFFTNNLSDLVFSVYTANTFLVHSPSITLFIIRILTIAIRENAVLWILALIGIIYILINKREEKKTLLAFWLFAALFSIFINSRYFGHYFIPLTVPLSIFAGYAITRAWETQTKYQKILVNSVALIGLVLITYNLFNLFYLSSDQISELKLKSNNAVVMRNFSEEIKGFVGKKDYIFSNRFPQIYFYTETQNPSKYFYSFAPLLRINNTKRLKISNIYLGKEYYNYNRNIPPYFEKIIKDETIKTIENKRTKIIIIPQPSSKPKILQLISSANKSGYKYLGPNKYKIAAFIRK